MNVLLFVPPEISTVDVDLSIKRVLTAGVIPSIVLCNNMAALKIFCIERNYPHFECEEQKLMNIILRFMNKYKKKICGYLTMSVDIDPAEISFMGALSEVHSIDIMTNCFSVSTKVDVTFLSARAVKWFKKHTDDDPIIYLRDHLDDFYKQKFILTEYTHKELKFFKPAIRE